MNGQKDIKLLAKSGEVMEIQPLLIEFLRVLAL